MSKITNFFQKIDSHDRKKRDREEDDTLDNNKRIKRIENFILDKQSSEPLEQRETTRKDETMTKKTYEEKLSALEKLKGLSYMYNSQDTSSQSDLMLLDQEDDTHDSSFISESAEDNEGDKGKKKKKGKSPYTPLELQYIAIRDAHPDTILFVESGYRYRFFGRDAEIASKVLNIQANMSHNFLTGSVPVHRLHVHARKLVQEGYKVGVVSQTETAALKAISNNKNGPFERNITAIYTKSTFIGDQIDPISSPEQIMGNYLLCIYETVEDKKVTISLVAIQTSSADIICDTFEDDFMRNELETRIKHIEPIEVVLPDNISKATQDIIEHMNYFRRREEIARIERIPHDVYDKADQIIDEKITLLKTMEGFESNMGSKFDDMNAHLKSAFAGIIHFLSEFGLDALPFISLNHRSFLTHDHMKISGQTLHNLELFQNSSTGEKKGSLFHILDHTSTAFGRRLLMEWIKLPLLNRNAIIERQEAVEEISYVADGCPFSSILSKLRTMPDLERGISRIYYQKSSVHDFIECLKGFKTMYHTIEAYKQDADNLLESKRIQEILNSIPDSIIDHVHHFLDHMNLDASAEDKSDLFLNDGPFPMISKAKSTISEIEQSIKDHLYEVRSILKLPDLEYKTLLKTDYTIDVTKTVANKYVPSNWTKLSMTKTNMRYHTPFIVEQTKELARWKETLALESHRAWEKFVSQFSSRYIVFRNAVKAFAELDCLHALSIVARQSGYIKPNISDSEEPIISIKDGRHPIIESILSDKSYVPNDCHMSLSDNHTCTIVSGPNMGGKTSYSKQIALICLLAQIGSFVPANEVTLTPLDTIYTRMGASDNMMEGKSTFFLELQETAFILKYATPRSLAILDELGRGTSTHDGFSIAYATLKYMVSNIGCFTLFITHYPSLHQLVKEYPNSVKSFHISYKREEGNDEDAITFLYKLEPGIEDRSFGMNVASLANLPPSVVEKARQLSHIFESYTKRRLKKKYIQTMYQLITRSNTIKDSLSRLKKLQQSVSTLYSK